MNKYENNSEICGQTNSSSRCAMWPRLSVCVCVAHMLQPHTAVSQCHPVPPIHLSDHSEAAPLSLSLCPAPLLASAATA